MGTTLSLKSRLIWLSTFLGLIIIVQASVVINANHQVLAQTEKINQSDIPLLNYAHELKLSVVQVQQWLTDISATRALDGLNDGFDEAANNAELFKELIAKIKVLDNEHVRDYEKMSRAFDDYYLAGKKMAQAYIDRGPAAGNATMASFDAAAAAIYGQVDPLLERVQSEVNNAQNLQNEAVETSKNFALVGACLVVVILLLITFNMINCIRRLPEIVEEMASADLNKRYHVKGNTEISQITQSLQIMRERLLDMIDNTSGSILEISKESEKIADLAEVTNKNIHEQVSQREQVATAMNEMTISTQEVANTISLTSDAAKEASGLTVNGQAIVDETTIQIKALATQIDEASDTIHELEQDSVSITGVLNVIRSIAEQTNLLALNAAIEAARAGEQGRGFAVVADEVRTLASRTQQSTEEVDVMLDKLLQGSKKAVEVMNKSKDQAEFAVNKVSETGDSLTKISGAVENIYDMSAQIATSAEQQSAVAEEINQNIASINAISNDSLTHMENLDSSTHALATKSMMLKDVVEKFNRRD